MRNVPTARKVVAIVWLPGHSGGHGGDGSRDWEYSSRQPSRAQDEFVAIWRLE